jgi:hypothetical protein
MGSKEGEVAGALGGLLGGAIGAGGAVLAGYLALSRQRQDDADNVADAVRTEIIALVKFIVGAIDNCEEVIGGKRIPHAEARYVVKNLAAPPIVYPAISDRIGLLPYAHGTIEFYMRIMEAKP